MTRIFGWATLGAIGGFVTFVALFFWVMPLHPQERGLWVVFSLMAAVPVAEAAAAAGSE